MGLKRVRISHGSIHWFYSYFYIQGSFFTIMLHSHVTATAEIMIILEGDLFCK